MSHFVFLALEVLFNVLAWLIIFRVLMSWFRGMQGIPGGQFVADITEPVLVVFRRLIPPVSGIDLSPLWAVLALDVLRSIMRSLAGM